MTASKAMSLVVSRHSSDTSKEYPGDSYRVEFLMQFQDFTTTDNITAPFDIVFNLGATTSTPIKYEDYTWGSTCKNLQFGIDATETNPAKTMSVTSPKCTISGTKLTINVLNSTDSVISSDWINFKLKFELTIKNPTNYIRAGVVIDAQIEDPYSQVVYAKAPSVTDFIVKKPTSGSASDISAFVSFGVDPTSAIEQLKGVGIYSQPYEITTTEVDGLDGNSVAVGDSNCITTSSTGNCQRITNALELMWTLPYNIPDDSTQAVITCKDNLADSTHDYLKIYQSSVVTTGFEPGNCWYNQNSDNEHLVACKGTGALTAQDKLILAFQFWIPNTDKTWANYKVSHVVETITCTMEITTWTTTTTSTTLWYTSAIILDVDGGSSSVFREWEHFVINGKNSHQFD